MTVQRSAMGIAARLRAFHAQAGHEALVLVPGDEDNQGQNGGCARQSASDLRRPLIVRPDLREACVDKLARRWARSTAAVQERRRRVRYFQSDFGRAVQLNDGRVRNV
jgi:hypothetical protein